ncbi:MAG: TOTE conflict system archaeo-eukaryotic primase domain-containing protein [Oleiphilus sp.]
MPYSAKHQSIIEIDARLSELEDEKNQLLALREQLQQPSPISPDSNSYTPEQKIAIFRGLFRGRTDIFANRWQNKQGRSGYSVACNNEWVQGTCHKPRIKCQDCNHRQFTELNDEIIYRHLAGQQIVGLYPLMPDNTCYFLAADFDKGQWQDEVNAMSKACRKFEIPHAIEISRSGNGAHLWIFFNEKVPAKEARLLGFGLLDKAMEFYPNLSFDSYDRLFPNQDILPEGGFGNLIALPLQKEARISGNSSFVNNDLNVIQDQWQHLAQMESISHNTLTKLLTQISPNSALFKEQEVIENRPPWEATAKTKPLILENSPKKVSVTLANHVYFDLSEIPSALAARLRRLASFSNPVFFKTQALRFSTHGIPRFISCARIEQGYLAIPRGCLDEALELLTESQIDVQLDDQRERGPKLKATKSLVKLRKNQQAAVRAMSKHDAGILHAPTAFGKTVTALA